MTREMNKPDWEQIHYAYLHPGKNIEVISTMMCRCDYNSYKKERKLDDWIKPFFDNCCRMEKIER